MPVSFSFNRKGSDHKTVVGGCLSIVVRLTLIAYTVLLTSRMINREDNKNQTFSSKKEQFESVSVPDSNT